MSNENLPAEKVCPDCGSTLPVIGHDVICYSAQNKKLLAKLNELERENADQKRFAARWGGIREAAEDVIEAYVNRFGTDQGMHGPIDGDIRNLSRAILRSLSQIRPAEVLAMAADRAVDAVMNYHDDPIVCAAVRPAVMNSSHETTNTRLDFAKNAQEVIDLIVGHPNETAGKQIEQFDQRKCSCILTNAKNTRSVRLGYEMSGAVKELCDYCKSRCACAGVPDYCPVHSP